MVKLKPSVLIIMILFLTSCKPLDVNKTVDFKYKTISIDQISFLPLQNEDDESYMVYGNIPYLFNQQSSSEYIYYAYAKVKFTKLFNRFIIYVKPINSTELKFMLAPNWDEWKLSNSYGTFSNEKLEAFDINVYTYKNDTKLIIDFTYDEFDCSFVVNEFDKIYVGSLNEIDLQEVVADFNEVVYRFR